MNLIPIKPSDAVIEYLEEKSCLGRDINYHRAIRNVLNKLRLRFPDSFDAWCVEDDRLWNLELSQLFKPITIRNYIKSSTAFLNWCVKRKYIHENICAVLPLCSTFTSLKTRIFSSFSNAISK